MFSVDILFMVDYKSVNLKIGLEIHQQLKTRTKLFSRCPVVKSNEFPIRFSRKLKASKGEQGKIDIAAIHESRKQEQFFYLMNNESADLVDMDEEPPRAINNPALYTVYQACKIMNCSLVDQIHVMRKTVLDGSVVSGFQRTALVGIGGNIKDTGIQTVCIEEDSSTEVPNDNIKEYRIDRQGIPLIEIATEPDMKTPKQAVEVALEIGKMLRSLEVRRGIGTIRQDVNISINNGCRVEIKGLQEIDKMEQIISNEIKRQLDLTELKNIPNTECTYKDVTSVFKDSKCIFMKKIFDEKGKIFAVTVPGYSGIFKKDCGARTVGREVSDYAKSYGYGIIHSDEDLDRYSIVNDFNEIKNIMKSNNNDLVLIIGGHNPLVAVESVIERIGKFNEGVLEETRVVDDIASRYARPLPGSSRMYPETDVPFVDTPKIESIEVPKSLDEIEQDLKLLIPADMATLIVKSSKYKLFEKITSFYNDYVAVANTMTSIRKDLERKGLEINDNYIVETLKLVSENKIPKSSIQKCLEMLSSGKDYAEISKVLGIMDDKELESIVKQVLKQNKGKNSKVLMGLIMKKTAGKADGKKVSEFLKKISGS